MKRKMEKWSWKIFLPSMLLLNVLFFSAIAFGGVNTTCILITHDATNWPNSEFRMYYGEAPPAGTYRACENVSELCVPTSFLAGTNILQGASPIALGTNKSYCFETQQLANTSVTNFLAVTAFQNNTTTIACPHYQCESDLSNVVSYTLPPATGTFLIQTSAGSGGTVSPNGNIVISQGVSQSITITPNACNKIATLTVDGTSVAAASPYLFSNIMASHTLNATFSPLTFSVNATVSGVGGTITPANYSIVSCGASPTFTITPSAGYQVSNVVDTGASKGALTSYTASNVIANRTVTATFTPATFALNLTKSGTGTGTISSSPVGISCGATCSANFNSGANVILTATPTAGSTFTGWTGACTGTTPTCTVAMNAVKSVGAGFRPAGNPVYRFLYLLNAPPLMAGEHFYTAYESEKASIIANAPTVWKYEFPVFYAYITQISGTVPVYRFVNLQNGQHHYTAYESEKASIIANAPTVWKYEFPVFYAFATQQPETVPVYRFVNLQNGQHFYTATESEKASIIANAPTIWKYEFPAFYVPIK